MKHPAELVDYQLERLEKGLKKLGIDFTGNKMQKLYLYVELLYSFNRKFALFSKSDEEVLADKHILPSLSILNYFSYSPGNRWIDIGSGSGFPAIPVKIFREGFVLEMIESVRKKAIFLKKVVSELGLGNTEVLNIRAETYKPDARCDIVTAWAVENPLNILKTASDYLHPGGIFIWLRGRRWSEELMDRERIFLEESSFELTESVKLPSFCPSPRLYANILRKL